MENNIEKPYVIGLDMGGTNSIFGIVDQRGNIKAQTAIKSQAYPDFKDYVAAAVEAIGPALDVVGGIDQIRGMGIGAPNANFYTGCIEGSANLVCPWHRDLKTHSAFLFALQTTPTLPPWAK